MRAAKVAENRSFTIGSPPLKWSNSVSKKMRMNSKESSKIMKVRALSNFSGIFSFPNRVRVMKRKTRNMLIPLYWRLFRRVVASARVWASASACCFCFSINFSVSYLPSSLPISLDFSWLNRESLASE